jgi:hypothetical protein
VSLATVSQSGSPRIIQTSSKSKGILIGKNIDGLKNVAGQDPSLHLGSVTLLLPRNREVQTSHYGVSMKYKLIPPLSSIILTLFCSAAANGEVRDESH